MVTTTDCLEQVSVEAGVITRDSTDNDVDAADCCSNRLPAVAGMAVIATLIVSLMVHIGLILYYWKKHRNAKKTRELPSRSRVSMHRMASDDTTRVDEDDGK